VWEDREGWEDGENLLPTLPTLPTLKTITSNFESTSLLALQISTLPHLESLV
jgi:hypothetical protein